VMSLRGTQEAVLAIITSKSSMIGYLIYVKLGITNIAFHR
jgi:hypothetical protein